MVTIASVFVLASAALVLSKKQPGDEVIIRLIPPHIEVRSRQKQDLGNDQAAIEPDDAA